MKFKVLLIGLGRMGMGYDLNLDSSQFIYSHARAVQMHPDFQFLGAVDISEHNRLIFETKYNLLSYPNIGLALKKVRPDVIIVSTPTDTHLRVIEEIFKFRYPDIILCEKPLANESKTAERILELCQAHACKLYVNFTRRADSAVKEVKRRLDDGRIQSPVKGVLWYSKGMLNNGSHFIDLVSHWLGSMCSMTLIHRGRSHKGDIEPDVSIRFQKGTVSFFAAREENFSYYSTELVSASGRLRYDDGGERVSWQSVAVNPTNSDYRVLDPRIETLDNEAPIYQYKVLEELSAVLKGGKCDLCTGSDAMLVNKIIHKIKGLL